MGQIPALARTRVTPSLVVEIVRALIVCGCALALILAGPALPF